MPQPDAITARVVGTFVGTPAVTVTRALVTWRDALGAARDRRLAVAPVGLHVRDERGGLTLWLSGHDGASFSPAFVVDGALLGPSGGAAVSHVPVPPEARDRVEALLTAH